MRFLHECEFRLNIASAEAQSSAIIFHFSSLVHAMTPDVKGSRERVILASMQSSHACHACPHHETDADWVGCSNSVPDDWASSSAIVNDFSCAVFVLEPVEYDWLWLKYDAVKM